MMATFTKDEKRGRYVTILSDGKFHETVPQGTEDAIEREYETSDGKTGTKHELVYSKIEGVITAITFQDSDYGQTINIEIEGDVNIQMQTSSNFGSDVMKKLPNVHLDKTVSLSPFAFTDENNGKLRKGVSIQQDGVKVVDYFYDKETKKNKNGLPQPEGDTEEYDKDSWKIYFMQVKKFLVKYTQENVCTKLAVSHAKETPKTDTGIAYPKDEINPDDIPFK